MWNKAVLDGNTGQWFPIPVWFRLLLDCGHANVSFVVLSPGVIVRAVQIPHRMEVGSGVPDVTHDVQVEFNRVLNSEQCSEPSLIHRTCSALALSLADVSLLIANLHLVIILLWPLELTTVQKLLLEGLLRAGGGRTQVPPPCTASRSILSLRGDCAWPNLQGVCGDEQSRWVVLNDVLIFVQWMGKTLWYSLTPRMTILKDLLCLFVVGVGKSSLLLRFADNTFSGEWFVSFSKCNALGLLQCCCLVRNLCLPTDGCAGNASCF